MRHSGLRDPGNPRTVFLAGADNRIHLDYTALIYHVCKPGGAFAP